MNTNPRQKTEYSAPLWGYAGQVSQECNSCVQPCCNIKKWNSQLQTVLFGWAGKTHNTPILESYFCPKISYTSPSLQVSTSNH